MIRELVNAGSNVNHRNRSGENILFTAVRMGRRDLVDYSLQRGVNPDIINTDGSTALLLALELYENVHGSSGSTRSRGTRQRGPSSTTTSAYATRRNAPSNIDSIAACLIPACARLNHQHPNRGSALRVALHVEAAHTPRRLRLTRLLLQHGATPDRLFFLRYGGLVASNTVTGAEFFTERFFNTAIVAGANLQRERAWLFTVINDMPEELSPHLQLFLSLLMKCSNPLPLQSLCIMAVRKALGSKPLWRSIEELPLPHTVMNALKLNE